MKIKTAVAAVASVGAAALAGSLFTGSAAYAGPSYTVPLYIYDRATYAAPYKNFGAVYPWVNSTYNTHATDGRLSFTVTSYKVGVAKKASFDEYVLWIDVANRRNLHQVGSTAAVSITEKKPKDVIRSANSKTVSSASSGCHDVDLTLSAGINIGIASLSAAGDHTVSLCSKSAGVSTAAHGKAVAFRMHDIGNIASASLIHIVDVKKGTVPVFKVATTRDTDFCNGQTYKLGCMGSTNPPFTQSTTYYAMTVK